jgi:hypothetical protein
MKKDGKDEKDENDDLVSFLVDSYLISFILGGGAILLLVFGKHIF